MANPSKQKGTAAETACVYWFRLNGFPHADRQPLRGNRDCGDINLAPGVVAEIKSYRLATGFPTAGQLKVWLEQADTERANAVAAHCVLIVKRPGTTDVGRWFAFLPFWEFSVLTSGQSISYINTHPAMLTVAAMAMVLRSAGYGTPLEERIA